MKVVFLLIFLFFQTTSFAQQLFSGVISDERNTPIPHAKLFVKNTDGLRTIADANGYFEMRLMPGEYYVFDWL
jgi:hypothetical protein